MVIKDDQGTWKYLLTCTHILMDMAEASFSIFLACGQFITSMASTTSQMWLLKQPFKVFSIYASSLSIIVIIFRLITHIYEYHQARFLSSLEKWR